MGTEHAGSEMVATFGGQLASHVGRRVRLYFHDGSNVDGMLVDVPLVYHALDHQSELILKGHVVLRSAKDSADAKVYNVEDLRTYDVLPTSRTKGPGL